METIKSVCSSQNFKKLFSFDENIVIITSPKSNFSSKKVEFKKDKKEEIAYVNPVDEDPFFFS